ncbi:MAG: DUF599 family protein [Proteobacteria bacterium]|nr:DUF599 family protein [Pseudomonadota bacterium]
MPDPLAAPLSFLDVLPWRDAAALGAFFVLWLLYEPLLRRVGRGRGVINRDMEVVRAGWMRAMLRRTDSRLLDANLMGHALNSASFFASANLILIAGLAGALFGGDATWRGVRSLDVVAQTDASLFQLKLSLLLVTLARGLLDFIWSIRQMNFWLAAVGAAPEVGDAALRNRWADALSEIINPALAHFAAGVRAYYFALASALWLLGPVSFVVAALAATAVLIWRQSRSRASRGVRRVRELLDEEAPESLESGARPS